eukprot:TRINITY_DN1029_c0_g1_i1.p1 TRINITY_DN1029_c0_g1~~TRINITY_DN1029_c0_g1_i1.p1  ORF type:complete len:1994 (-),score=527.17 TRINITY_DN1029_c0_g1_i1:102-6083(-)
MEEEECMLFHRPYQLLVPSEDRTNLSLNSEALDALKSLTGPVALVCIVGTQRGGKSTLLNLMHSRQTAGFGLGHYMDAQTTGFWIWARRHPRNKDLTILLMDTEGLDTPHIPQFYNWTLAALALLCSTFFIYQSKGSIDSTATDRLGVILQVAEQIGGRESISSPKKETDKPEFLWLIRDHHLSFGGKEPKDEMMRMLDRTERRRLEDFFDNYDCFPLPRPVDSDDMLKYVDTLKFEDLRTDFKEEYCVLERQVFQTLGKVRKMVGQVITGTFLGNLFEKYVVAVSAKGILDDLSQLPTQKELIFKMKGEKAADLATQSYIASMSSVKDKLPVADLEIFTQHKIAYDTAKSLFLSETGGEGDEIPKGVEEYFKNFENKVSVWLSVISVINGECIESKKLVSGIYSDIIRENSKLSEDQCLTEIKKAYATVQEKLKEIPKNFKSKYDFEREVEQVKTQYFEATKNLAMSKIVAEDFLSKVAVADGQTVNLALLQQAILAEIETKNNQQKEEIARLEAEMRKKNEEIYNLQAKLDENVQSKLKEIITDVERRNLQTTQEISQKLQEQDSRNSSKFEQIQTSISSLKESSGDKFLELKTSIAENTLASKEQLASVQGNLTQLVNESKSIAEQQIQKSEERSTQKIADESKQRSEKEKELRAAISETETKIASRLDGEVAKISEKLQEGLKSSQEQRNKLQEAISENKASASASLKETEKKLEEKIASVASNVESESKKTSKQFEEQSEESKKTEARITSSVSDLSQQFQEKISSLQNLLAESRKEDGVTLAAKLAELKEVVATSESNSAKSVESLSLLTTQKLDSQKAELAAEIKQIEEKTTSKVSQLAETTSNQHEAHVSQLEELKKALESLQATQAKSESALETQKAEISTVSETAQSLLVQIGEHKSSLESLTKDIQANTASASTTTAELHNFKTQVDGVVEELRGSIKVGNDSAESLSASLADVSSSLKATSEKVNGQESDLQQLRDTLAKLEQTQETTQSSIQTLATKDELSNFVTQEALSSRLEPLATKELLSSLESLLNVTKESLSGLEEKQVTIEQNVQAKVTTIENSITALESQLQNSISELKPKVEGSVSGLDELRESVGSSLAAIQPQFSELLSQSQKLQTQIDNSGSEFTEFKTEIKTQLQSSSTQFEELKTELKTQLQSSGAQLEEVKAGLASQVESSSTQLEELKTELKAQLQSSGSQLEEVKAGLASQIESSGTQLEELKNELKAQIERSGASFAELSTHIQNSNTQLEELKTELKTRVENTGTDLTELKATLQSFDTKVEELETKLKTELDGSNAQVKELKTQIEGSNTQVEELKTQLEGSTTQVEDLKTQVQSAATTLGELSSQVQNSGTELSEIKSQVSSEIPELRSKLDTSSSLVSEIRTHIDEHSTSLAELKSHVHNSFTMLSQIQAQVQSSSDAPAQPLLPPEEFSELKVHVLQLQTQAQSSASEISELRSQWQQSSEEVSITLRPKVEEIVAELSELRSQLQISSNESSSLQPKLAEVTESLSELRSQWQQSSEEVTTLRPKLEETVAGLSELRAQLQNESVRPKIEEIVASLEELRTQVQNIEDPETVIRDTTDTVDLGELRDLVSSLQADSEKFKTETKVLLEEKLQQFATSRAEHKETNGDNKQDITEQSQKLSEFNAHVQSQLDKMAEKISALSALDEGFQSLTKTTGENTVSLNHLHIATKSTFMNVEKSMNSLQRNLDSVKRQVETSLSGSPSDGPVPVINTRLMTTSDSSDSTTAGNLESLRRELIGYTDKSLEAVLYKLSALKEQYSALTVRLAELPANASVSGTPVDGGLNTKVAYVERSIEELKGNQENIVAMIQGIQMNIGSARQGKTSSPPSPSVPALSQTGGLDPLVQRQIQEEMISQRKQLVAATKTHVGTVADELRKEMEVLQLNSKILLKSWEDKIQKMLVQTPRGQSNTPGNLMSLDERLERTRNEMENTKSGMEAIWASIAQLSAKLVDIESEIDR